MPCIRYTDQYMITLLTATNISKITRRYLSSQSAERSCNILSLAGMRIVVTGSRRATELAHLISNFGGTPKIIATVGFEINQRVSKEIEDFINKIVEKKIDYIIFMTGPGVYLLMSAARCLGLEKILVEALNQITIIICRSFKSKYALADHGIKTDIIPQDNTAEGIARALNNYSVYNKNVAILWPGSDSSVLRQELLKSGAQVVECSIYTYSHELKEDAAKVLKTMGFNYNSPHQAKVVEFIEEITKGFFDAITFTSPPAVFEFFKIAEQYHLKESLQQSLNQDIIVVAVGPSTEKALAENRVKVDVMPKVYKMGPMVKALSDYVIQTKANKGKIQSKSNFPI
ncbi:MAG: uroporphyrinogen-III synthase [Nitrososphaeraceae archaeon]|nr:uroporphyrinogen-III synthase [Nitrososphaeraceae archaeon]